MKQLNRRLIFKVAALLASALVIPSAFADAQNYTFTFKNNTNTVFTYSDNDQTKGGAVCIADYSSLDNLSIPANGSASATILLGGSSCVPGLNLYKLSFALIGSDCSYCNLPCVIWTMGPNAGDVDVSFSNGGGYSCEETSQGYKITAPAVSTTGATIQIDPS